MSPKDPAPSTDASSPAAAPAAPEEQATMQQVRDALTGASSMDAQQVMNIFRELPAAWAKSIAQAVTRQSEQQQQQGDTTSSAAETLSHLAQAAAAAQQPQHPPGPPVDPSIHPQLQGGHEPGPSSHPNGPPSLGMPSQPSQPEASMSSPTLSQTQLSQADDVMKNLVASMASGSGGRRRSANPMVGTDEWRQQRKNNHKEVERRRRGNINFGIEELARIVPNGTGEKAKGAILSRAVQYILHLKENEARNIEKWTLEKLLMDQAMGDLQIQLDEYRKLAEEERRGREKAEAEVKALQEAMDKMSAMVGRKRVAGEIEEEDEQAVEGAVGEGEEAPPSSDGRKGKKKQKTT